MIQQRTENKGFYTWLALGDSYTIGEGVAETDRYPLQAAALLKKDGIVFDPPQIIAVTGWTTGNLIEALARPGAVQPRYDVVTLLIGVNNQYQGRSEAEYELQFASLLTTAIHLAGDRPGHVVVLSIPDYSVTPFGEQMENPAQTALVLDRFNQINSAVSDSLKVHYVAITAASREARHDRSLIAGDDLHYSGKEYAVWAAMLTPVIKSIFGE